MTLTLFTCHAGHLVLPNRTLVLVSRESGGNLLVNPLRTVWERAELTPVELMLWSFLVAAAGKAMLEVLPQLEGGCINYWEAGNWALNDQAIPPGPKTAPEYRQVHLHLLGRSRTTTDPSWKWGEAPRFPDFVDRHGWAANNERLTPTECQHIVARVEQLLQVRYGLHTSQITPWATCTGCGYPTPVTTPGQTSVVCLECCNPSL